jgi:hypothetical protein
LRNYLMKQKQWRNAITKKQQSFPGKTAENIVKTYLSHPIAGWFFYAITATLLPARTAAGREDF